jgi:hypothetical protein
LNQATAGDPNRRSKHILSVDKYMIVLGSTIRQWHAFHVSMVAEMRGDGMRGDGQGRLVITIAGKVLFTLAQREASMAQQGGILSLWFAVDTGGATEGAAGSGW